MALKMVDGVWVGTSGGVVVHQIGHNKPVNTRPQAAVKVVETVSDDPYAKAVKRALKAEGAAPKSIADILEDIELLFDIWNIGEVEVDKLEMAFVAATS